MANRNGAKDILSQIFSRIGELSDALSPSTSQGSSNQGNSIRKTSSTDQTVEGEVRKVFGRPSTATSTSSSESVPTNAPNNRRANEGNPLYTVRRYSGNQRSGMKSITGKRREKKPKSQAGPFTRDVILLTGPEDKDIPRQGNKVFLQQNGHVINAFNFLREWSEIDVELEIRQAFEDKLPQDVDIEILHSVHTSLLAPTLAAGQRLTGLVISKIFGNNKPVYIRPLRKIIFHPEESCRKITKYDLPEDIFDSDDDWVNMVEAVNQSASKNVVETVDQSTSVLTEQNVANELSTLGNAAQVTVQTSNDPVVTFATLSQDQDMLVFDGMLPDEHIQDSVHDVVKEIAIHRSNLLKDMILAFKDESVLTSTLEIVFINERGNIEEGRGSGVKREAFSLFWREFYNALASGALEKVPSIRHDYQKTEWQSVSRILVVGFSMFGYFPIALSKAFVASCMFTEELIPKQWLLESFYLYISKDESETIKRFLAPESDDPSIDDDLLEVLSSYKCYRVVTKENMQMIIDELAHQELIQRPKYIANAWIPIVAKLKQHKEFKSVESLNSLYEAKRPSAKRVCNLLIANPFSDAERESMSHLKCFIKSLDDCLLCAFLRFISGSDVINVEKVDVTFSEESGLTRRPVAHTCAPMLVIPATYQSYNELSEEFGNILRRASEWSFHIV